MDTNKVLSAISKMLEFDDEDDIKEFKVKVQCAKMLLDELLDVGEKTMHELIRDSVGIQTKPNVIPQKLEGDYLVVLNDDKTLKEIKNLPKENKVLLDKKEMSYEEAIGRKFREITIL